MAIYAMADRTSNVSTAAACMEARATATDRPRVIELSITLVTAAATVIGLGRPAALGTVTGSKTVLAEDGGDPAGTMTTSTTWIGGPTVPANFFRRWSFAGVIGAGVIATFPRGLVIAVSNSIVLWNILGGATLDVGFMVDE